MYIVNPWSGKDHLSTKIDLHENSRYMVSYIHVYSGTSELRTRRDHAKLSAIGRCPLYRECTLMWRPFPVVICHVFESLVCMSAERPRKVEELIETALVLKNSKYFSTLTQVSWDCPFSVGKLYRFVHWGVTSVSVIQSKDVSAIRRLLCTVNCREWFGTAAICPHYGGFRNTGSPFSEVHCTCDWNAK